MNINNHNKIIIIGSPGSGKSRLSKGLAEITGHPLYHLDKEFWQPGWVMTPKDERITRQQEMTRGGRWIIDGNYGSTMEIRFVAADLIIFLDINRFICIFSAIKRRGKKRSDMPDYLKEPKLFSKDYLQFLKWIWAYPKAGRKAVMALREKYPYKTFLHIKSRSGVRKWFKKWESHI